MSDREIKRIKPSRTLKDKTGPAVHGLGDLLIDRAEKKTAEKVSEFDLSVSGAKAIQDLMQAAHALGQTEAEGQPAILHNIFEIAHDLRGESASFGYPLVSRVCKSLCRLVEEADAADNTERQKVQAHVDALAAMVTRDLRGETPTGQAIADELERLTG